MKKYLLFCIIVLLLVGIGSAVPTGYSGYKSLHINGSSAWAGDQTNIVMKYFVHRSTGTDSTTLTTIGSSNDTEQHLYVGTIQSDYDDIRFTNSSGTEIDYWLEEGYSSSVAGFWVEVPSISKTTGADIRMYYGNSAATSGSNGTNTFSLFDTFDGSSIDPTRWSSYGGVSVADSRVRVYKSTGYEHGIISLDTYGYNYMCGMGTYAINCVTGDVYAGFSSYTTSYGNIYSDTYGTEVYGKAGSSTTTMLGYYQSNNFYVYRTSSSTRFDYSDTSYAFPTVIKELSSSAGNAPFSLTLWNAGTGNFGDLNYMFVAPTIYPRPLHSTVSTTSLAVAADFSADQTTIYEYQTVAFTDSSTGTPTVWNWSFGSGEGYSSDQNPTHQYTTPGKFTVVLNATNTTNVLTDTETKLNYITVLCSPVIAAFTTNVTNGAAPLDVAFTSTSTNATAWEWDFDSDGDIDSTDENPNWTYPSVGFWSPTLVVYGNGTCEDDEVKEDYIYVSMTGSGDTGNISAGYGYQYPPKDVRFKVMTMFGEPIDGCSVIAQGITTTTGSWDWLIQLFGVSLNETPIMNTNMSGTTDSNGEIVFLMIPSVKYNMSFYRAGEINQLFYITPKDEYYNIYSTTGGESYYEDGYDYNAIINITLSTTDFGASDDYITVTYVDSLSQTTDADIYIYETSTSGETLVNSTSLTPGGSFTQSLLVEDTPGHSYHIRVETTHTTFGSKTRDFTVIFPDTAPTTFGFPSELLIYFAIFILIFVGMFFGAASATAGSLIVCFVGWILYAIGWLNSLGATAPVALSAATAFSIFAIIAKAYREDR